MSNNEKTRKEMERQFRERIRYQGNSSQSVDGSAAPDGSVSADTSSDAPYKEERQRQRPEDDGRYKAAGSYAKVQLAPIDMTRLDVKTISALTEKLIELESAHYGISEPNFLFCHIGAGKDAPFGYTDKDNIISINLDKPLVKKADYVELVDTIIHEVRHVYQYDAIQNPNSHPEATQVVRDFLRDADLHYPVDYGQPDYWDDYWRNALEQDAFSYAEERRNLYLTHSLDQILQMQSPPERVVNNQILMNPGSIAPNGTVAPITVWTTGKWDQFSKAWVKTKSTQNETSGQQHQLSTQTKKHGSKQAIQTDKGGTSMDKGTDFSESAQTTAANFYMEAVSDIQNFSQRLVEETKERLKEHPYKQLENLVNCFVDYHKEQLPNEIVAAIEKWKSSENSFSNLLVRMGEEKSSASVQAANKLENAMVDRVRNGFHDLGAVQIDKAVQISKQLILQEMEFVRQKLHELENMRESWKEKFINRGESENDIYSVMIEMVVETFMNSESLYYDAVKDYEQLAEAYEDSRAETVATGNTSASAVVSQGRRQTSAFAKRRNWGH